MTHKATWPQPCCSSRNRARPTSPVEPQIARQEENEELKQRYGGEDGLIPVKTATRAGLLKAKLSAEDQPEVPDPAIHRRYRSMVGAIGWLSNGTRPDISYAYLEMSKYVQRPGLKHMEAAEYCLRYLSGTVDLCIEYRADADQRDGQTRDTLWGWVDADFAADTDTRRSHTGYIIMLNGGPVSWKSTLSPEERVD
jgi:hypothetical protein